jgi:hypothetical protein
MVMMFLYWLERPFLLCSKGLIIRRVFEEQIIIFQEVNGRYIVQIDGAGLTKMAATLEATHWHPIDFFAQRQKVND